MSVTPQDMDAAILSLNSYDVGDDPSVLVTDAAEGGIIGN
jgi:hypothetical protein